MQGGVEGFARHRHDWEAHVLAKAERCSALEYSTLTRALAARRHKLSHSR